MTEDASCSEILVLELLQRADLHNCGMMSLLNDIKLIFVGQTEHQEVSISEGRDHDISTLTSYRHGVKGLVRFDCVVAGL